MTDELEALFGLLNEAVFAARDGVVGYANSAAIRFFPDIVGARLEDALKVDLSGMDAGNFVCETAKNGQKMQISVTPLGEYEIWIARPNEVEDRAGIGTVFSVVSGEMRNHLAVMKTASGMLFPYIENMVNGKLKSYIGMSYHAYYNMLRLTNNMSMVGEALEERGSLQKTYFDFLSMCRELVESVAIIIRGADVQIGLQSRDGSIFIYADKKKLEQMILNLISNSLIYTQPGGAVTLTVNLIKGGSRVFLTVSDTGAGITPEAQAFVWNRYSAERDFRDVKAGAGLGMTVVQHIVHLHGGGVVLESHPGEGTNVSVYLPVELPPGNPINQPVTDYSAAVSDMNMILTELASAIGPENYLDKYQD